MVRPDELVAHARFVRAVARDLVREPEAAEDVAQSTLLIGLERPPRSREGLMAWIVSVARSVAASLGRRDQTRRIHEPSAASREAQPSTLDVVAHEEIVRRVVDAVFELDEPYRTAILLRYYEDLKPGAIARRLEVPVETVRTRLKRGLARVREKLDERSRGGRREWAVVLTGALRLRTGAATSMAAKAAVVLVMVGGAALVTWRTMAGERRANDAAVASESPARREPIPSNAPAPSRSVEADDSATPASTPIDPALVVRGTVVDEQDRPITGARVWVLERDNVENDEAPARLLRELIVFGDRGDTHPAAVTPSDGSFLIQGLPLRTNLLLFEADGFCVRTTYSRPCTPMREPLRRCVPLSGVVVDDSSGAPLADVGVMLSFDGMDGGNVRRWARTVTARDGSFSFTKSERSKKATLTLDRPGCMPVAVPSDVTSDGEAARATVRWPATTRCEGCVVDDASGAPLEHATICRFDDAWFSFSGWETDEAGFCRVAQSDANGNFAAEVAAGGARAVIFAAHHLPRMVMLSASETSGDRTSVRLYAAPSVEGEVRDTDGRPVAGARLFAVARAESSKRDLVRRMAEPKRSQRGSHEVRTTYATSDADGRFCIDGVFDDESWCAGLDDFEVHVDAFDPRLGKATSDSVTVRFTDVSARVTVRFDRGNARRVVTGRLLAGGAGIAGNVHCEAPGNSSEFDTNDRGEFAFEVDASAADVELVGVARAYRHVGDAHCIIRDAVHLDRDGPTRHDLVLPGRRDTIHGTIRDADGHPVAKDRVRAFQRFKEFPLIFSEVFTDEGGEYVLDVLDLCGDRFEITAVHGAWSESRSDVPMDAKDVDFVVPRLGKIRLIVHDPSTGRPMLFPSIATRGPGETKFATHDSSDGRRQLTDPAGAIEIELPLGTYDLRVGDTAHRAGAVVLEHVVAGETPAEPIVVDVLPMHSVLIRIVNDDADPLPAHRLYLLSATEAARRRVQRDGDQGWRIEVEGLDPFDEYGVFMRSASIDAKHAGAQVLVLPGMYILCAAPDDLDFVPQEIDVAGASTEGIAVHVRRRTRDREESK